MLMPIFRIQNSSKIIAPLLVLMCFLTAFPSASIAANNYIVGNGITATIDEHGTCKKITNNHASGKSIMVPTKSSAEWSDFRSNIPPGVTQAVCVVPCGGISIGGYCWYLAQTAKSCDFTCASYGGANLIGTRDYTGSGGTAANCGAVSSALIGVPVGAVDSTGGPHQAGCTTYQWLPSGSSICSPSLANHYNFSRRKC